MSSYDGANYRTVVRTPLHCPARLELVGSAGCFSAQLFCLHPSNHAGSHIFPMDAEGVTSVEVELCRPSRAVPAAKW